MLFSMASLIVIRRSDILQMLFPPIPQQEHYRHLPYHSHNLSKIIYNENFYQQSYVQMHHAIVLSEDNIVPHLFWIPFQLLHWIYLLKCLHFMRQFWTSSDVEFHDLTIWSEHISNFCRPYRELGVSPLSL